ncbi:MAG: hypothetical protein NTX59_12775 [Elusimicrobia bacterium]|nr:hypothetical protein [Elusimicrobiota bacterium]
MKTLKAFKLSGLFLVFAAVLLAAGYFTLPVNRINMHSRLLMLGDLNFDNRWDKEDASLLAEVAADPFSKVPLMSYMTDVNHNGLLDDEDIFYLTALYKSGDPYKAFEELSKAGKIFPYPREFFRYLPETEYIQRPLIALEHPAEKDSPLKFLGSVRLSRGGAYEAALRREIYSEGIRFSLAYAKREAGLTETEKKYSDGKIARCTDLWKKGELYGLLLELTGLTEDAETLTAKGQPVFIAKLLYFRDHLKGLLESAYYRDYLAKKGRPGDVLKIIQKYAMDDMGFEIDLANIAAPRDFLKLENYVERAKWQYYKSTATRKDFLRFLLFAQYDRRYLRAAARTTKKLSDIPLENHNLPMILLFREALEIKGGDKLAAVGLIDEAIRIPFAWVKTIPRTKLPTSVALENFLLPGNKEDGSDKSRHWNVFGGISLYKSPQESLRLALAREVKDLREADSRPDAMTEFIRDTIANINGIYYVMTINPELIK